MICCKSQWINRGKWRPCQGYNPKATVYGQRVDAEVLNSQCLITRVIFEINYSFHCIFTNTWKVVKHEVMVVKISHWTFRAAFTVGMYPPLVMLYLLEE